MGWIEYESFWLFCPHFANVFIRRKATQCFQSPGIVVSIDEVCEMNSELIMIVVVEAFDGGILDRPVHAFYLPIGPGMSDFC